MTAYMLRKDRIVLMIYSPTLSQSTNTLIPGRMRRTSSMGRAFTAKVRISKLPCVLVAFHVAKSACTDM